MKKFLSLMLASLMMVSVLAGCGGDSEAPAENGGDAAPVSNEVAKELKFTTGSTTGTYYGFGTVLAGQISKNTESKVTAVEGKGSKGNVVLMDMGDAQLGFVQSDVMSYAYNGTNLFADTGKIDNFSTLASLYMEQVQIVTCDPNIKSVEDLRGKNVSVGEGGSGVFFNAVDVLGAYGMDVEKDINAKYLGFSDSADALKDGKIDAAFLTAGAPTVAVTELAAGKETYLVSMDQEHIDALIETSPYYSAYTIPADVYSLDEDVHTVAVGAVIIARDDVSEADAYNVVSGIFENLDAVAGAHDKGKELSLEAAASVTSVPYHPGAAKYFTEKGLEVPVK